MEEEWMEREVRGQEERRAEKLWLVCKINFRNDEKNKAQGVARCLSVANNGFLNSHNPHNHEVAFLRSPVYRWKN